MAATVISGKTLAQDIRASLAERLPGLKKQGIVPALAVVLVGNDPASTSYVAGKEKACADLGMVSRDFRLPETTSEQDLLSLIADLNADDAVHGILVQLPLPPTIRTQEVIRAIDPAKDVDGFHPDSLGKLFLGEDTFIPCTPHGIVKILERTGLSLPGLDVVVVGRSNIVGKPVALLLSQPPYNCTVTVCHSRTRDLGAKIRAADVVVAAVGKPRMITADMVKTGACVIDVGVNRVEAPENPKGYVLVGDTDYGPIAEKAAFVTPVPGGVGPMTITMLMYNTIKAACRQNAIPFEE